MGKTRRRFADRPRITIRALMWFVLVVALSNGLCMMYARWLHASAFPIERIWRAELLVFFFLNANALLVSLYLFYAPWWGGKTRREVLKESIPGFVFNVALQSMMAVRESAVPLARTIVSILLILLVLVSLIVAAVLSVRLLHKSRSGMPGFVAPPAAGPRSRRAPEAGAVWPEPSRLPG